VSPGYWFVFGFIAGGIAVPAWMILSVMFEEREDRLRRMEADD
jgi:hypothetical protein